MKHICPGQNNSNKLIPKKSGVCTARDLRPISLENSIIKILSKVLALRLQCVLDKLINPFQMAFIRGRSIMDNFFARMSSLITWCLPNSRLPSSKLTSNVLSITLIGPFLRRFWLLYPVAVVVLPGWLCYCLVSVLCCNLLLCQLLSNLLCIDQRPAFSAVVLLAFVVVCNSWGSLE